MIPYNDIIRKIAKSKDCNLIDIERSLKDIDPEEYCLSYRKNARVFLFVFPIFFLTILRFISDIDDVGFGACKTFFITSIAV